MALIGPDNAIAWAQLQLRGGWKKLLINTAGYALLIVVGFILWLQFNNTTPSSIFYGSTIGLLALQGVFLVLLACGRIATAIGQDITRGMIESHRLMTLPASHAIAGYLTGPASGALAFATVNLVLGAITATAAGITLDRWLLANFILFFFAIFLWAFIAFVAFTIKIGWGTFIFLIYISYMGEGFSFSFLPGLFVLLSPIAGGTIFEMRNTAAQVGWLYLFSIFAQFFIGAIFYIGSARRYRRPDAIALSPALSLALLAIWVAVSAVAMRYWEEFRPAFLRGQSLEQTQLLSTIIASMLLAILPIAGAAKEEVHRQKRRLLNDPASEERLLPSILIVLIAAGLILLLAGVSTLQSIDLPIRIFQTAVVLLASLFSISYFLRILNRITTSTFFASLWILLTWLGPLLISWGLGALEEGWSDSSLAVIFSFSPIGSLIQIWDDRPADMIPGLAIQLSLAALLAMIYHKFAHRWLRQSVIES